MKKIPIARLPGGAPTVLLRRFSGAPVFDCSCSPEARVYFIDRDGGYFLKTAARGTLSREAEMGAYFHKKALAPAVLDYVTGERDWLLTARAAGEDATSDAYINDPKRLASVLGEALRALHESDFSACPVMDRMSEYFALADENYKRGCFDLSLFGDRVPFSSAEEAYAVMREGRAALSGRVLLHGDYCLPNVMLDNWRVSAFIDVGGGGVGDRHVDLFWGAWTLWFNLKTDRFADRFFDAYGRDLVDRDLLLVVAAAEIFA